MPYKDKAVRKQKHREYSRRHYENNKDYYVDRAKESKEKIRQAWWEFKSTLKCVNCGFSHPAALDFHHVIRKAGNRKVNELLRNLALRKAMEEVQKCVVLCANCHRIHHYDEQQVKLEKRRKKKRSNSNS